MGGWEVLHRGREVNIKYNKSCRLPFKTNKKATSGERWFMNIKNMQH